MTDIQAEVERDVGQLVDFVAEHRRRHGAIAMPTVHRVMRRVDTAALRALVRVALSGRCNWTLRRRCARILSYADTIDAAHTLGSALFGEDK